VKKGLLFASTNRSVYVSFNDGSDWQSLTLNLPTTSVRDILIHGNDLVAGTQGRGIWVLDDIEPLREINPEVAKKSVYLFTPAIAWRLRANENHDTPWPPSTSLGKNPPTGAIIDYRLKNNSSKVKLTILDAKGRVIRSFAGNEVQKKLNTDRYFEKGWIEKPQKLSSKSGMHRFVWNLRYPRPDVLRYRYSIAAVWDQSTPVIPEGPLVLPGIYKIILTVDGKNYTKKLVVKEDPRVHISSLALREQLKLALTVNGELNKAFSLHRTIGKMLKKQKEKFSQAIYDSLSALSNKGHPSLSSVISGLSGLATIVQAADAAPTQGQRELFSVYKKQFNELFTHWRKLMRK